MAGEDASLVLLAHEQEQACEVLDPNPEDWIMTIGATYKEHDGRLGVRRLSNNCIIYRHDNGRLYTLNPFSEVRGVGCTIIDHDASWISRPP